MKTLSKTSGLLMASVAASVIAASAGFADTKSFEAMDTKLQHELTEVGVTNVNVSGLTHKQLGELSAVFSEKKDPTAQKQDAERIINAGATKPVSRTEMLAGIRDNVGADLKSAGIDDVDVQSLSMGTVEKLADVFATGDQSRHEAEARAVLEQAHAGSAKVKTVADLPAGDAMHKMVVQDMESIGIEVANPEKLTSDQLSKIAKVFQEKRNQGARAEEVKKILGN